MLKRPRTTWAEVNLDNIAHNIGQYRRHLGSRVEIMAVVKADGYGLGAVEVSKAALAAGASWLAVAFFEEAVELRRARIEAPILLFGFTPPELAPLLLKYKLTPLLFGWETAQAFSRWFAGRGCRLPVHLNVDTGMGRLGIPAAQAVSFIEALATLPGIEMEGLLTHLATADEEDSFYTNRQLDYFNKITTACRERGIEFRYYHAANSAGAAAHPGARFNLVRLGISLYGYYPSEALKKSPLKLRAALSLKSRIVMIKEVPPGTAISYGRTYVTSNRSIIATVPVGYGDGYSRELSNRGQLLVRGRRVPVIGRVCMDHLMLDLSGVQGAAEGDEVVVYGRQGEEEITLDEVAGMLGTINYELLCRLGKRVARLYLRGGRMAAVRNLLECRSNTQD